MKLNGAPTKPSSQVRKGDRVETKLRDITKTYLVLELSDKRVGAAVLPELIRDDTPPEEFARADERRENARLQIPRGVGRPTKKNRRDLEKFFGRPKL